MQKARTKAAATTWSTRLAEHAEKAATTMSYEAISDLTKYKGVDKHTAAHMWIQCCCAAMSGSRWNQSAETAADVADTMLRELYVRLPDSPEMEL
jgi:hypothetical protein